MSPRLRQIVSELIAITEQIGDKVDLPTDVLAVPVVRQALEYTCGPGALAAVLYYWEVFSGPERDLYDSLGTTEKGTSPSSLVKTAKKYGLKAEIQENLTVDSLRRFLSDGKTVILSFQAWPKKKKPDNWETDTSDGHYAVLIGLNDQNIFLMDPAMAGKYGFITIKEFVSRWHDKRSDEDRIAKHLGIVIWGSEKLDKTRASKVESDERC